MRRDKINIIYEILENVRFGNHLLSHIAFSCFLNYDVARKYIDLLELSGLVETRRDGRRIMVFLTDRGRQAIRQLNNLLDLLKLDSEDMLMRRAGGG